MTQSSHHVEINGVVILGWAVGDQIVHIRCDDPVLMEVFDIGLKIYRLIRIGVNHTNQNIVEPPILVTHEEAADTSEFIRVYRGEFP